MAIFHPVGKYPILIKELNKIDKNVIAFLGIFFIMVLVIKSCPGNFLLGNFFMMSRISLGLEYGRIFWGKTSGSLSFFLTRLFVELSSELFNVNAFTRVLANISHLS